MRGPDQSSPPLWSILEKSQGQNSIQSKRIPPNAARNYLALK